MSDDTPPHGLWQHRDFVRLWSGQTVSVFGSLITRIALPFTAIVYLDASAFQVAILVSSDVLAGILFGLIAGVWVDRLHRRPIMIAADVGRAAIIGSIPMAAVLGGLRIEHLYLAAFSAGILTSFFDVAYQSYLPSLVEASELIEGNSKLNASASVAEFGAFSISGWLVQILTGPGAIFIDAFSFLVSAAFIRSIHRPEPPPPPREDRQPVLREIAAGLRAVRGDPVLLAASASWVVLGLASGMLGTVFLLYTNRELGFSPGILGVIFGVGGVSSLGGAAVAGWTARRFGIGNAMVLGMALGSLGLFTMAGASGVTLLSASLLVAQQLISDPAWTVYEINQVSLRQAIAPPAAIGRVNGAVQFARMSAMLCGALLAGAIATVLDARSAVLVGATVTLAGAAFLYLSPVRRVRASVAPVTESVAL